MFEIACTECGAFTCHTREELRSHLEDGHGINMETQELEFDSMEQFLQWKKKMEDEEKVFFMKRSSEQMFNSEKPCLYYSCNYSQTAMQCSLGKTLNASPKIVCPASLMVSKVPESKINVKFYMTHTGHKVSMGSLNHTYANKAMVAVHLVPVSNSTDGSTVEEDGVTLWQQDLQHSSNGPVIVAVEQSYFPSWQQELQHGSAVPVSVTVEETDTVQLQEQTQHSTPVSGSVTVEENDAQPCQQELQHNTQVPCTVTVEENDAMQCPQELQHSTSDICRNMNYNEELCKVCGISFRCRKSLYRHLRELHDMELNLNEGREKCHISEETFSGVPVPAVNFHKKIYMQAPEKVKGLFKEGHKMFSSVALHNHPLKMSPQAPQKMSCTECGVFTCHTREELVGHLECEHGINMETKELEFDSMEEFLQWKRKMEANEKVFFSKLSSAQMVNSEKSRLYYTCLHSQTALERSLHQRLRTPPKTNQTCPASLIVSKVPSCKVIVKYYKTHIGHSLPTESLQSAHTDRAVLTGHIVPGRNSTDGATMEEDSVTPQQNDLQLIPPCLNTTHCVAVEHNYAVS